MVDLGEIHRIEPNHCLDCGHVQDAVAAVNFNVAPKPNDFAVCAYCGYVQAFDTNLRFRKLTDDEVLYLVGDKKLLEAMDLSGRFRKLKKE